MSNSIEAASLTAFWVFRASRIADFAENLARPRLFIVDFVAPARPPPEVVRCMTGPDDDGKPKLLHAPTFSSVLAELAGLYASKFMPVADVSLP
mmetsp:Transcript_9439/g.21599  ORF Transcript_9439/g.21599 Transcript_9439/m.21599 type:complete len:94 (-) Transcript_9439:388-669(-)